MIKSLTETQQKVLNGITNFITERGFPPTIREIMDMFGYASVLRTLSSGRANYSMEFLHYSAIPKNLEEKLIEEKKGKNK